MAGERKSSRATKPPVKYSPPAANPRKRVSDSEVDGDRAPKKARKTKTATGTKKAAASATATSSKAAPKGKATKSGAGGASNKGPKASASKTLKPKASGKVSRTKANIAVKRGATSDEPRARSVKKAAKKAKPLPVINRIPVDKLDIFVNGEGGMGELGLGTSMKAIDVKRPRLNPYLTADTAGVLKMAVGGMHCVAITYDNKIMTWGVNDHGALGRDTSWSGGLVSVDEAERKEEKEDDSDADSDDDNGLNPKECVPTAIPEHCFPDDVLFVDCAAGDSVSFALTSTGLVYGWGVFRGNNGPIGFDKLDKQPQHVPVLVPGLKNITKIVCGANHAFALDKSGTAYGWGSGEQHQLGRKLVERTSGAALKPSPLPLPPRQIRDIFTGSDHGFAIKKNNDVLSWGINSFCETGHRNAGLDENTTDIISPPTKVKALIGQNIIHMEGGNHHTVALNDKGECLTFGCTDSGLAGIPLADLPEEDCILNDKGQKRILVKPTVVPGVKDAVHVAAGTEHSIAITGDGNAYTWGFSTAYQTAQGTDDDVLVPTVVVNGAVRDRKMVSAGGGGQFTVLMASA